MEEEREVKGHVQSHSAHRWEKGAWSPQGCWTPKPTGRQPCCGFFQLVRIPWSVVSQQAPALMTLLHEPVLCYICCGQGLDECGSRELGLAAHVPAPVGQRAGSRAQGKQDLPGILVLAVITASSISHPPLQECSAQHFPHIVSANRHQAPSRQVRLFSPFYR